ncbi:MAG TPA: ferric iron uptake transcriptional regulator [Rhodocyclaceae bacterium]|nr:MAG: transcriptional repressor [Betaproteobacteria bacterium CG2_30_68_42]PIX74276.1 MAG: ferric iron uptake transcriptional regulator [Rhodocyclales bacterium CG_4_10_14_3_um_filter_68_10]PJA58061.1 MAG: ferric iron uptake transcriptional regulator [Rhodocyclales bacterium CG_4_9_14_3_um_filter_68_10]HCX34861.1 ferric iron uptake transcriptional regulator [Rhodocyclaceae bacterium]
MSDSQQLKSIGLKATSARLRILDLFRRPQARHMSAEDVYRTLTGEGVDVGLATIYRVLTQFEEAGLLERHYFESGRAAFELKAAAHHDHIVCIQCGRVEEFFDQGIETRQQKAAAARGFAVRSHALTLYCDCVTPECPYRAS